MTAAIAATIAAATIGLALRPRPARLVDRQPIWPRPQHPRSMSSRRRRRTLDTAYPEAIDLIVLAVRAGFLPAAALRAAHPHVASILSEPIGSVLQRLDAGDRFSDALSALTQRLGHRADTLVDTLAAADRDGLPLAPVLERLAAEAHAHRRRQSDTLARQLPIRLSIPLVVCTLPSFVLLAVVPLLLAALSSLGT